MKEYKVLPCPFCGGEAHVVIDNLTYHSFVECQECGARGAKLEWESEYCATDLAAEKWNKRAILAPTSKLDIVINKLADELAERLMSLYSTENDSAGGDPE